MKNLKELGFKNLETITTIKSPKCCEHGEDMSIVLNEEDNIETLFEVVVAILHENDIRGAALILMNKENSKAFYPISVFDKNEEECTIAVEFKDDKNLIKQGKIEEYHLYTIKKFNEMITKNKLKTILVLKQDENDELAYDLIY